MQRTDIMDNKEEPEVLHQLEGNARALTVEREFVLELGRRFPATCELDPFIWKRFGRMHADGDQAQLETEL